MKKKRVSCNLRIIREQNRLYNLTLRLINVFRPNGSKVFLFHDILEDAQLVKSKFAISKKSFELFLKLQLSRGYHANTYDEMKRIISKKDKAKDNSFIVTFDDANESVFINAFPFLKLHNIPFIVFITEVLIDKPNYLKAEQIVVLANDPLCTIGSHGCHHTLYRNMTAKEVEKELSDSKCFLEKLTQKPVECFAFPYGRLIECSIKNVKQLKDSDYIFSFSAIAGSLDQSWLSSNYFLPRINVDEKKVNRLLNS